MDDWPSMIADSGVIIWFCLTGQEAKRTYADAGRNMGDAVWTTHLHRCGLQTQRTANDLLAHRALSAINAQATCC